VVEETETVGSVDVLYSPVHAPLRGDIENIPGEPRHLITVHRVGYKFVP
jgi:hypothetical protein